MTQSYIKQQQSSSYKITQSDIKQQQSPSYKMTQSYIKQQQTASAAISYRISDVRTLSEASSYFNSHVVSMTCLQRHVDTRTYCL